MQKFMICGLDCRTGDKHCNGYCTGKTNAPPAATPEMALTSARNFAFMQLRNALKAWEEYDSVVVDPAEKGATENTIRWLRSVT